MEFSNEIYEFITKKNGGITIVAEGSGEIVFADDFFKKKYGENIEGSDADQIYLWADECPELELDGDAVEWENIDMDSKCYYRFNSAMFEKNDKRYKIHFVTDITEYMGLNRDITKYMSFFRKLSGFQAAVLEKLSDTFYSLMPMLTEYFKTNKIHFFIQRDDNLDMITYNKMGDQFNTDRIEMDDLNGRVFKGNVEDDTLLSSFAPSIREVLMVNGAKEDSCYRFVCGGTVSGQKYALYLSVWPNMDLDSLKESTLANVIKLYIENGIMREKLIYESEHDHLSGLLNKGKYLDRIDSEYRNLDSIAIYNMDVNNLKTVNDTLGHEMGDKLIIKAANSIRKVTSDRIHGYRMGGDEFLIVACNVSEKEALDIKARWEAELTRLNIVDTEINCVVAVGMVYGTGGYDLQELLKKADELMYEDKKAKKKPGEEIR